MGNKVSGKTSGLDVWREMILLIKLPRIIAHYEAVEQAKTINRGGWCC